MNIRLLRTLAPASMLLLSLPATQAVRADDKDVFCIETASIKDTVPVDVRTMLVRTRVGKSYRIEFAGGCKSFGGFSVSTAMGGVPKFCKSDMPSNTAVGQQQGASTPGTESVGAGEVVTGTDAGAAFSDETLGGDSCKIQRMVPIEKVQAEALNKAAHGLTSASQAKWDKATGELRDAIKLDPTYAGFYRYLGIVLEKQGKVDEAFAQYRLACDTMLAAIKASPNDRSYVVQLREVNSLLSPRGGCSS